MSDYLSLNEIQNEISRWSEKNFGSQESKAYPNLVLGSLAPLLGVVEEVGELCHATLKYHQGIRGYDNLEYYRNERDDAVGDIMVYLCDYASREGIDLQQILNDVWQQEVSKRNWTDGK